MKHNRRTAEAVRLLCLTIHKVQKMYLWELSEGGGFFSLPAGKKGD